MSSTTTILTKGILGVIQAVPAIAVVVTYASTKSVGWAIASGLVFGAGAGVADYKIRYPEVGNAIFRMKPPGIVDANAATNRRTISAFAGMGL